MMSTIMTPTFYAQTPVSSSSQPVNSQARQDKFQTAIKPLLRPDAFSGAGAVGSLVTLITQYGSQDVGSQSRLEILTKIRDNAPNHYFRAWSESTTAIDVTREWLKAGATAKSDSPLVETIMPLLHVSDMALHLISVGSYVLSVCFHRSSIGCLSRLTLSNPPSWEKL
jgi:hypothetical protein